eukprot:1158801-Pelagomonas_calceolata.AAC.2
MGMSLAVPHADLLDKTCRAIKQAQRLNPCPKNSAVGHPGKFAPVKSSQRSPASEFTVLTFGAQPYEQNNLSR